MCGSLHPLHLRKSASHFVNVSDLCNLGTNKEERKMSMVALLLLVGCVVVGTAVAALIYLFLRERDT